MDRRQAWAQWGRLRAEDRERQEHRAERHQVWDPVDQHPTGRTWDREHQAEQQEHRMDRRQAWAQRDRLRAEDRERQEHRAEPHQAWDPVDQHPTDQAWDPEHRGREEHPTARRQV